jgi:drug/metabolite transporter (DMT)-like permease
MYFGMVLGILAIGMSGLIGTAFLYNYIVTTFSAAVVSITTIGVSITIAAAALAGVLVLMDNNDFDL